MLSKIAEFLSVSECPSTSCPRGACSIQSQCSKAPAGTFGLGGASACQNCSAGTYTNSTGFSICATCGIGTYSLSGFTTCTFCPLGKYSNSSGQSSCVQCPTGYSTLTPGAIWCPVCEQGFYMSNGSCMTCPTGKFSSVGQSECNTCSAGRYTESLGNTTSCQDCDPGKFQSVPGLTSCDQCDPGNFNPIGSLATKANCSPCAAGKFIDASTTVCLDCQEGFWSNQTGAFSRDACKKCPAFQEVICFAGTSIPYVGPGFFRFSTDPGNIVACVPSQACVSTGFDDTVCAQGYIGDACSFCSVGFFRSSGKCIKCLPKAARWTIIVSIAVVFLVLLSKFFKQGQAIPTSLKVFFFWVQFISLFPALSSSWPSVLLSLLNFTNIFNIDVGYLGLGCDITNSYFAVLTLKILLPFLILIVMSLEQLVYSIWVRRFSFPLLRMFANFVFVVNFFSVQLLSSMLQIFNCTKSGNNMVVTQEPSVICRSAEWTRFVVFDVFFLVFYVTVVPLIVFLLYRSSQWKEGALTSKKEIQETLIKPLTMSYIPGKEWFEISRFVFKLGFILLRDVIRISSSGKITFVGLWMLIFMWMQYHFRPYSEASTQNVSLV
jgi:hypothetical protein